MEFIKENKSGKPTFHKLHIEKCRPHLEYIHNAPITSNYNILLKDKFGEEYYITGFRSSTRVWVAYYKSLIQNRIYLDWWSFFAKLHTNHISLCNFVDHMSLIQPKYIGENIDKIEYLRKLVYKKEIPWNKIGYNNYEALDMTIKSKQVVIAILTTLEIGPKIESKGKILPVELFWNYVIN